MSEEVTLVQILERERKNGVITVAELRKMKNLPPSRGGANSDNPGPLGPKP